MSEILKKYDFIISLGRMCHVSAMLANNGLKIVNGPWDWLATSDAETIYKRIESLYKGKEGKFHKRDFKSWEPYQHKFFQDWCDDAVKPEPQTSSAEEAPLPKNRQGHGYYNVKNKTFYLHDFFEEPDFGKQLSAISKKYMRRFQRTLNFIEHSERVLLVYMNHLADQRLDLPLNANKVIRLMEKLRRRYPGKTIDLYMFDHSPHFKGENFQRIILDVGIVRYLSNHDEVFPATDTDPRHTADGLMMPQSVCYILSKVLLTDRNKMI